MKSKKYAILLSALVCPGAGQLLLGKKRGYAIIVAIVALIIALAYSVIHIVVEEISPDLLLNLNVLDTMGSFLTIRSRVYGENMFTIISILALWLGSIIDIVFIPATPENIEKSETINR